MRAWMDLITEAAKLPMDEASRLARAEAMGFDTSKVWYHGTMRKTFKAFRVGKDGIDELGSGIYFTGKQGVAGFWGRPEIGGRTLACYLKKGLYYDYSKLRSCKQTSDRSRNKELEYLHGVHSDYLNDRFGDNSAYDREMFLDTAKKMGLGAFNMYLQHAGYIGAVDHTSQIPDQVVVFDPVNIRSIDARFDPAKAGSANIRD